MFVEKLIKGKLPSAKKSFNFLVKDKCTCQEWKNGESIIMGPYSMFGETEINLNGHSVVVPHNASERFECVKMMRDEPESSSNEQSRRSSGLLKKFFIE